MSKLQPIKGDIDRLYFTKINRFYSVKDCVKRIKIRATAREKHQITTSIQKDKELSKLSVKKENKKENNNPVREQTIKVADRQFTKEDRYTSANKHMKKCSKSFPETSVRMAEVKNKDNSKH